MLIRSLLAALLLACGGACTTTPSAGSGVPMADEPVDLHIGLRADGQLELVYSAPPGVHRLPWLDHGERAAALVRGPMLHAVDECGSVERDALVLSDAAGCGHRARFTVQPRVLDEPAFNEAAQPSSDGGVLLFARYYAVAVPGHGLNWRFVPPDHGYVVDAGRAWTSTRAYAVDAATVDRSLAALDHEEAWRALQATREVYLGRTPVERDGDLLWVRDPALPSALTRPIAQTAAEAMRAYAEASGRRIDGAAIVMLRSEAGRSSFHGDRNDERMLRLSFNRPSAAPSVEEVDSARHFVAHEIAHLWNHGVFASDMNTPWLHEGDAEWASHLVLLRAGWLSQAAWQDDLDEALNGCLLKRGERPARSMHTEWSGHEDDPYACGMALQLLSWVEQRARDPRAEPLAGWGAMHRAAPMLDATAFARYADGTGEPTMQHLLLDADAPFATTYVRALSALLPLQRVDGEPGSTAVRRSVAAALVGRLQRADCGAVSYWLHDDHVQLDAALHCRTLPPGAMLMSIAGEPVMQRPLAAWREATVACRANGQVALGLRNLRPVSIACPSDLPEPPLLVALGPGALARAGLAAPPPAVALQKR